MVEAIKGFDGSKRIEILPVGPGERINIGRKPMSAEEGERRQKAELAHVSVLNEQRDKALDNVRAKVEEVGGGEILPSEQPAVEPGPEAGIETAIIKRPSDTLPLKNKSSLFGRIGTGIKGLFKGGK